MSRLFTPLIQLFDASGATAGSGTITFYAQGTETLQATYQDAARTLANENPLTVDGSGLSPAIYLQYLDYTVLAKDSDGVTLWQKDFDGRWLADGSDYTQGGTGSVARTVQSRLAEYILATDFGATADGSTDDTAAIQLAINAAQTAGGGTVWFGEGKYILDSSLAFKTEVYLKGSGRESAILEYTGSAELITGNSLRNIGISDMTLQATSTPTAGIRVNGCLWGTFRDLMIKGFKNGGTTSKGIYLEGTDGANGGCYHNRFENITLGKNVSADKNDFGIYIKTISGAQNRVNNNVFTNIQARFGLADGMYFDGASANTILGGAFEDHFAGAGIRWDNDCVENIQIGGFYEDNDDGDIFMGSSGTVTGAMVIGCDLNGTDADSTKTILGPGAGSTGHTYLFGVNTTGLTALSSETGDSMFMWSAAVRQLYARFFEFNDQAADTTVLWFRVLGESGNREIVTADGIHKFANGTDAVDVQYSRTDIGVLKSTGIWIEKSATASDGATTPSVQGVRHLSIPSNTGGTVITQLDDGVAGQTVTIYITNATNPSTIVDGGNFKLSAAWSPGIDDNITLHTLNGSTWNEVGRSDN